MKCNDKLYEVEDRNSYINHNEDTIEGYYRTDLLKIDDLDSKDDISIIPIKCNIKRSEIDSIIYAERDGQEDSEENNVKYKKEFKFLDNSKGVISKIERKDDKVKVYFSSASDKDSLLMALSMYGYYDYKEEDSNIHYNYEKIEKVIYKNPEEESGYVVEFDNVVKDKKFIVDADNIVFSYNDKFDMDEEIKIK